MSEANHEEQNRQFHSLTAFYYVLCVMSVELLHWLFANPVAELLMKQLAHSKHPRHWRI